MISEFPLYYGHIFENAVIGIKWGLNPFFVFWRPNGAQNMGIC